MWHEVETLTPPIPILPRTTNVTPQPKSLTPIFLLRENQYSPPLFFLFLGVKSFKKKKIDVELVFVTRDTCTFGKVSDKSTEKKAIKSPTHAGPGSSRLSRSPDLPTKNENKFTYFFLNYPPHILSYPPPPKKKSGWSGAEVPAVLSKFKARYGILFFILLLQKKWRQGQIHTNVRAI